jgi:uncharacterized membrane protein YtjA (UPF0391 family)
MWAEHASSNPGGSMLRWALISFLVALMTAAAGFLGIAAALSGLLKFFFILSIFLFLSLLAGPLIRPPKL